MVRWNVSERITERTGTYHRVRFGTDGGETAFRALGWLVVWMDTGWCQKTAILSNTRNCWTERIRTYHNMIQLKETHGRTYQNFSGTYRNVPQKHQACTKTGKNVPELFWNVSERTAKFKTIGRTYQNVPENKFLQSTQLSNRTYQNVPHYHHIKGKSG